MDESRPNGRGNPLPPYHMLGAWDWNRALSGQGRELLENILGLGLAYQRWFGSKARSIRAVHILDALVVSADARLLLLEVEFTEGLGEVFQLPLTVMAWDQAAGLASAGAAYLWARVELLERDNTLALVDALADNAFCGDLLRLVESDAHLQGETGELAAWRTEAFAAARGDASVALAPRLLQAEQSNTSVIFGDRLILKLFRRLETGVNPDLELIAHLTARGFAYVPPLVGAIEYRRAGQEPWSLAVLQRFVPNRGDAWQYVLGRLERLLVDLATRAYVPDELVWKRAGGILAAAGGSIPSQVSQHFGPLIADARRLGLRTGEMHLALAAGTEDPAFTPVPLSPDEQRLLAERSRAVAEETFGLLRQHAPKLPDAVRSRAVDVLAREEHAMAEIQRFAERPIEVATIRVHGDFHLGQVLVTAGDFMIIDFEGEPARPLAQRRAKQLALRDVAGMIRSLHYASCAAAVQARQQASRDVAERIDRWAAAWYFWTSASFLAAYRQSVGSAAFVPRAAEDFERVLDACLLEKAVYELRYELNNRPLWVYLPLAALGELLG